MRRAPRGVAAELEATMLTCAIVAWFVLAGVASGQTSVINPAKRLIWDQPDASAAEAQAMTFRVYADGSTTGTVLTGVTCAGDSASAPVVCSAPFPAFTPGKHALTITAANTAGEGPPSAPMTFTFVIVPSAPMNLRSQ